MKKLLALLVIGGLLGLTTGCPAPSTSKGKDTKKVEKKDEKKEGAGVKTEKKEEKTVTPDGHKTEKKEEKKEEKKDGAGVKTEKKEEKKEEKKPEPKK